MIRADSPLRGTPTVTAEGGSAKISSGDAVVASSNSVGIFAHDNFSIAAGSTVKATGGAAEAYTEDTTTSLIVSSCGIETSADEAVINGRVEAAGGTAKGSNSNPITCGSYGVFLSRYSDDDTGEDEVPELTVNGTLDATAADTEAAATGERGDAEAYSYAVYVLGDVIIGDNAVVTATGGRADSTAEQRGAYAKNAGIYVDDPDNFTVGTGASVTAKGGDVTGDGVGNSNNGADSYGIYVCEDGGSTDGIKGVIAGDVIAAGGKATGMNDTSPTSYGFVFTETWGWVEDVEGLIITGSLEATGEEAVNRGSYESAVSYGLNAGTSKVTVSGTLSALGGKTTAPSYDGYYRGISIGIRSGSSTNETGPDIILKDGCWLIAAGDNYALTNTSYGGAEDYNITLPETYRWRTSADSAFTASGTEPYTFSANHTYVEIAPVSVAAESVTVEPGTLELEVSETGGLSAVIVPSIATDTVTWSSSDEGVVEGVSDTEFAPDDTVTREQLAAILWRYAGEPATAADLNGYADGASVSGWAVTAMSWAVENMIITGSDGGLLSPLSGATRAQCAAILARFMEL